MTETTKYNVGLHRDSGDAFYVETTSGAPWTYTTARSQAKSFAKAQATRIANDFRLGFIIVAN